MNTSTSHPTLERGKRLAPAAARGSLAVLAMMMMSACGSGSPAEDQDGTTPAGEGDELISISVGVLPIAPSVAVQYGIDEGIFESHGLDVELTRANSGAAMLPAVANQQIDIGVGNPLSVMVAADTGLNINVLSGYSNSLAERDDINGVVTEAGSGIESFEDLAGKTVAINQLRSQGDLTIMEMAEQQGADPSSIEFSEIPFAEMPAHLEQGNVDAIWVPEPFLSSTLADDANQLVGYPNQEAIPGLPTMVTFASGDFAEGQPETVEAFRVALAETLEQATANEDDSKGLLTSFMDLPAEAAATLRMEEWDASLREQQLQDLADLAEKFGYVGGSVDVSDIIAD